MTIPGGVQDITGRGSGLGDEVGLDGLRVLFQPEQFWDSVTLSMFYRSCGKTTLGIVHKANHKRCCHLCETKNPFEILYQQTESQNKSKHFTTSHSSTSQLEEKCLSLLNTASTNQVNQSQSPSVAWQMPQLYSRSWARAQTPLEPPARAQPQSQFLIRMLLHLLTALSTGQPHRHPTDEITLSKSPAAQC